MTSDSRPANRLAGATSPYLLQHAHNPVDWYPWGEEALARARAEDKPILLSIGYSACHWCHVMERESFEDEDIAALMNEHFVLRQGGPRGAARPRRHLHGGHPGHEPGPGRLADDGVPDPGAGAVLRRHLLPARGPLRPARASRTLLERIAELWQTRPRRAARRRRAEVAALPAARARARARAASVGEAELRAAPRPARPRLRRALRRLRPRAQVPALRRRCRSSCAATGASATSGRWRWCARRWTRWRAAGCTTRSAAASTATPWTSAGWCPTSRRCSTTTRCWRARTWRATRSPATPSTARIATEILDYVLREMTVARGRLLLRHRRRLRGRGGQVLRLDARGGPRRRWATRRTARRFCAYYDITRARQLGGHRASPTRRAPGPRVAKSPGRRAPDELEARWPPPRARLYEARLKRVPPGARRQGAHGLERPR